VPVGHCAGGRGGEILGIMHSSIAFLTDLALVLGVAAVTSVLSQRLRLPPVFGYLLAGVIIGPNDLVPLVADIETVRTLSELGVILLMFSLGLGFTFRKIARLATTAGLIAALEVALCLSLGYGAGQLLGWTGIESLFAGAIVAISSTMIIAKVFEDQSIKGPLADVVFGVLVMEDLLAILALAVLTAVANGAASAAASVADTLPRLVLFLATVILVGLLVVPRFFRRVVRLRSDETTLVASIGLCFTLALLAQFAGYSVALGAFLAGAFIAEGGASRQVEPMIRPLRDMFAAIFFVAVGMSIEPSAILTIWPAVLVLAAVVLLGKTVGVTVGAFMAGLGTRTAVRAGLSMGQIGEFSFIIAGLGVASGVTGAFLAPVAVYVSVVTSLLTPVLVSRSGTVANTVDRRLPRALQTYATLYGSWIESVRGARAVATPSFQIRRLARFIALDAILLTTLLVGTALAVDRDVGRLAAWSGLAAPVVRGAGLAIALAILFPLLYGIVRAARALGDAIAHQAVPPAAPGAPDLGLAPRRALRVTVQIGVVLIVGMPMVAVTLPFLPGYGGPAFLAALLALLGIAFWRSARNLQGHIQAGALMIVEALGASSARQGPGAPMLEEVRRVLPGIGRLTEVTVGKDFAAAGKTLSELNLRGLTGASVVGLCRGNQRIVLPSAREQLRAGDILAITGNQRAIASATALLHDAESVARQRYHDATER
jgi:CPA2 family monovalent cation:H+ antiporter-2